jgi:hypothetical protein
VTLGWSTRLLEARPTQSGADLAADRVLPEGMTALVNAEVLDLAEVAVDGSLPA